MPTTLPNIPLNTNVWTDLYDKSSISVGERLRVYNTGSSDIYIAVSSTEPAIDSDSFIVLKPRGTPYVNDFGDVGLWAFSNLCNGQVNVNIDIGMSKEFFFEVRQGNIPGYRVFDVIGRNPQITNGEEEDIWDVGGTLEYPTAGEQLELKSDDVDDTSLGDGARIVRLRYQDTDFIRQVEDITTDGTNWVQTVATNIYRTESLEVISAGSIIPKGNIGKIELRSVGGQLPRGAVLIGENVSLDGHYTVPAGKVAYFFDAVEEINKNEDVVIEFQRTTGENGIFLTFAKSSIYQSLNTLSLKAGSRRFEEKTDFKLTALSTNPAATPFIVMVFIEVDII